MRHMRCACCCAVDLKCSARHASTMPCRSTYMTVHCTTHNNYAQKIESKSRRSFENKVVICVKIRSKKKNLLLKPQLLRTGCASCASFAKPVSQQINFSSTAAVEAEAQASTHCARTVTCTWGSYRLCNCGAKIHMDSKRMRIRASRRYRSCGCVASHRLALAYHHHTIIV